MSSERYLHGHHESVLRSHAWRTAENSAAYLLPSLAPGLAVLDVGCGPGTITADLALRVAPGRVVGLDAAEPVLEQARRNAREQGAAVEFVTGDAYRLPFPEDSFDIAHAHQVLQHLADPVAALREMMRVVRPGGVVAIRDVDYGGSIWYPESAGLTEWLSLYRAVAREAGGEPDAGRRLPAWARAAGAREVTTTASVWAFTSEDERRWWGGSWAERATQSEFATRVLESGAGRRKDLERIALAWLDWADEVDAWFSFPHTELLIRVGASGS